MTTVVKLGGSLLEDAALRNKALDAIAAAWSHSTRIVVVHGGGKHIDQKLSALGIPKRTAGGLRVTDAATLDVVVSTLAGTVNKMLVSELQQRGCASVGLSGADGETVVAELHPPVDGVDLGFVGRVTSVHPELVRTLTAVGFLPLIGSIATGASGELLNVNADSVAAAVAVALGATRLVFLTDVEGLRDGSGQVIERLELDAARSLVDAQFVSGGMKPKLRAVVDALSSGVPEVLIAGPSLHAAALLDGKGGTHLVAA